MTKTASHSYDIVVRSYELDPYQHVNNGAYVNWLEDARERFLRTQDRDWTFYPRELDVYFVVVKIDCDYLSAARAGERIELTTRLARRGRTSVVFRQLIRNADGGRLRARARVVMVFAGHDDRAVPIPDDFTQRFETAPEGDTWTEAEGGERG